MALPWLHDCKAANWLSLRAIPRKTRSVIEKVGRHRGRGLGRGRGERRPEHRRLQQRAAVRFGLGVLPGHRRRRGRGAPVGAAPPPVPGARGRHARARLPWAFCASRGAAALLGKPYVCHRFLRPFSTNPTRLSSFQGSASGRFSVCHRFRVATSTNPTFATASRVLSSQTLRALPFSASERARNVCNRRVCAGEGVRTCATVGFVPARASKRART